MKLQPSIRKIAFISSFPPRHCGIATFTQDLITNLHSGFPQISMCVIAVSDSIGTYSYSEFVQIEIDDHNISEYKIAAEYLNLNEFDIVCVQHEFGIFGGTAGSYILMLLENIATPVITTLHTILDDPNSIYYSHYQKLRSLSTRFVTMNQDGAEILSKAYSISKDRIDVIPHGIPDVHLKHSSYYKDKLGISNKFVLLTYGLLSPDKGIEYVLMALPKIKQVIPEVLYLICGETHPKIQQISGNSYRENLDKLVKESDIENNVTFYNGYLRPDQLEESIGAADICIIPYLNEKQISSGTLAYCFGAGKVVIATPFTHAKTLLSDGKGIIVPFKSSQAIADAVINLYNNKDQFEKLQSSAYYEGREMRWSEVAQKYFISFEKARNDYHFYNQTTILENFDLPEIKLDHMMRMTDSNGILQHAKYSIPDYNEGYCTDDNARALLLTILLDMLNFNSDYINMLKIRSIAFLNSAFNKVTQRFRNFMDHSRRWLDEEGSEDSHGRAIWALGTCIGKLADRDLRSLANQLFKAGLTQYHDFSSPRTWAFILLGIGEYLKCFNNDIYCRRIATTYTNQLLDLFTLNSTDEWLWFENIVSYDNARIPQALLVIGAQLKSPEIVELALKALKWLVDIQTTEKGYFRPIGSNGFYKRGEQKAMFDQQPIEASAMISGCIEAFRLTNDYTWFRTAKNVFTWYLGNNDLGTPIYNESDGSCRDALQVDRINRNQGAESTISFLSALAELYLLEHHIV